MAEDKTTIGVVPSRAALLEDVVERGLFADQLDAAKFCIALAVRGGVAPGEVSNAGTKWNVGSFDRDGSLRTILTSLYPNVSAPYRLAEHFVNEGLALLELELQSNPDLDVAQLSEKFPLA